MIAVELLYLFCALYMYFACDSSSSDEFINNSGIFLIVLLACFILINWIIILITNILELIKKFRKKFNKKVNPFGNMSDRNFLQGKSEVDLTVNEANSGNSKKSNLELKLFSGRNDYLFKLSRPGLSPAERILEFRTLSPAQRCVRRSFLSNKFLSKITTKSNERVIPDSTQTLQSSMLDEEAEEGKQKSKGKSKFGSPKKHSRIHNRRSSASAVTIITYPNNA